MCRVNSCCCCVDLETGGKLWACIGIIVSVVGSIAGIFYILTGFSSVFSTIGGILNLFGTAFFMTGIVVSWQMVQGIEEVIIQKHS